MDYAAATPMSDAAINAFVHVSKAFYQNTESLHDEGLKAKELLEHARDSFAKMVNRKSSGIYFTSGGSDGNFLAITSLARGLQKKGKHIITSAIEHPSVDYTLHYLERNGFDITRIPVDIQGKVLIEEVKRRVRPDTILATIQHVNSETGVTQDIGSLGELFAAHKVAFHSDCVQSFTKFDAEQFNSTLLDAFTVSSHKLHGPKGTGAVYINPKIHISPLLTDVSHERGFKAGTVDLPSIVSFVTAAEESMQLQENTYSRITQMRKQFISLILGNSDITFEGSLEGSPFILPFRIKGIEGQLVMQELNRRNIAVSTGSACKNGQQSPSKTLIAMNRTPSEAHGLVRVSLSRLSSLEEIITLCEELTDITKYFNSLREVTLR
jgi:cysteine desulfurase